LPADDRSVAVVTDLDVKVRQCGLDFHLNQSRLGMVGVIDRARAVGWALVSGNPEGDGDGQGCEDCREPFSDGAQLYVPVADKAGSLGQ
jgi:hypothetical protein